MGWKRGNRKEKHCRSKIEYLVQAGYVCVDGWRGVRWRTKWLEGGETFSRNVYITMSKGELLKGWGPKH